MVNFSTELQQTVISDHSFYKAFEARIREYSYDDMTIKRSGNGVEFTTRQIGQRDNQSSWNNAVYETVSLIRKRIFEAMRKNEMGVVIGFTVENENNERMIKFSEGITLPLLIFAWVVWNALGELSRSLSILQTALLDKYNHPCIFLILNASNVHHASIISGACSFILSVASQPKNIARAYGSAIPAGTLAAEAPIPSGLSGLSIGETLDDAVADSCGYNEKIDKRSAKESYSTVSGLRKYKQAGIAAGGYSSPAGIVRTQIGLRRRKGYSTGDTY